MAKKASIDLKGAFLMKDVLDFLAHFSGLPPEQWVGLIALASIGLAAGCLWVVHSVIKGQSK